MENLNNSQLLCLYAAGRDGFRYTLVSLAVVILVVLGLTQRRRKLMTNFFFGVPGIVAPANFLTATKYRFIYATVFGAMTGDLLKQLGNTIANSSRHVSHNPYWNSFSAVVITPTSATLFISCKYFPLFACVNPPFALLGHIMGLIYSFLLTAENVYEDYMTLYCPFPNVVGIFVAGRLPIYVCFIVVLLWYFYHIISDFHKIAKNGYSNVFHRSEDESKYYSNYVRRLFLRRQPKKRNIFGLVLKHVFPYKSSATKLPMIFVGTMTIITIFLYQITFTLSGVLAYTLWHLMNAFKNGKPNYISWLQKIGFNEDQAEAHYATLFQVIEVSNVILPAGPIAAMVFCFILLIHMCATVYGHIGRLYRGDISFTYLHSFKSSAFRISAAWRYAGYQLAYLITAYVTYTAIIYILSYLVYFLYRGFEVAASWVFLALFTIIMPILWVVVVYIAQIVLCKLFFLRGDGKFAEITNQRVFQWMVYILFIFNALAGVLEAAIRLVLASLFGLLLMFRLDRIVLMRGFEFFDMGHKTYLGFLYLTLTYNNPVVHTFVRLLREPFYFKHTNNLTMRTLHCEESFGGDGNDYKIGLLGKGNVTNYSGRSASSDSRGNVLARNRWLVAYTLLRNPGLVALRGGRRVVDEEEF